MMKFVNDFETGSRVIRDKFPEFRNARLVGDDSGWDNYAVAVNDEYLFRFPRRQESLEQIQKEVEVLDILQAELPPEIEVPKYLATRLNSDYPFVYYKMIQGKPLTKELYDSLTEEEKARFVRRIVEFLRILHGIDVGRCKSLKKVDALEKYQDLYRRVTEICFKYLTETERAKTKRLFEDYLQDATMRKYAPTVVHNDLSENHILVTETGIGVIDFGDTDIFDPAMDVSWFYLLDRKLFREIVAEYCGREDADFENRISQFYVPIIPYYGVIYGEETHNQKLLEEELDDLRRNLAEM